MNQEGEAFVIGAGIGGLASAIALTDAGMNVTVLEQAEAIEPLGAGLSIWPNGVRALRALGLSDLVDDPDLVVGDGAIRAGDGSGLAVFGAEAIRHRWGEPLLVMHRADLHRALLERINRDSIRLGEKVERIDFQADLVVGADGIHSSVRQQIVGDGAPTDSGIVAHRGVSDWDGEVPAGEWWGEGTVAGLAPLPGGRVYWYVAYRGGPANPLQVASEYASPLPEIAAATPVGAVLEHRLFDRPTVKQWSRGNATLVGDAAHPMLPFLGQGACAALEDAAALGRAVAASADVAGALNVYERSRVTKAARAVKGSRQAAGVALAQSARARRLRNALIRRVPQGLRLRQLDAFVRG